jgi:PKD domain
VSAMRPAAGLARLLAYAAVAFALMAGAAQAVEPHPHLGRLPGYPAMRGVVPVLGSSAAVAAREKTIDQAFATAGRRFSKPAQGLAEPNTQFISSCAEEELFFASQDVCYRGGPVLHDPTIHLIFWQGRVEEDISKEPNVKLFPLGYIETVKRYLTGLAHDSGQSTNTFAVDAQYGEEATPGDRRPGEYALTFAAPADITVDNEAFPVHSTAECDDASESAKGPCLLSKDLQAEVEKVAGTSEKGLQDVYVVLTPPGVGGCFETGQCAYEQYCAFHGDFGGDGVTPGQQTLYADLPYVGGVPGCDPGVHPNASEEGADPAIDDANHEINETITDPLGSQCKTGAAGASECERNAWTDAIGQEIADKCLPPESTVLGAYGERLGEVVPGDEARAYNQLIDGEPYWVQRMWSNEAGLGEGGCVQRTIGASFTVSAGAAATVPIAFDGGGSGAPGDPAVYWVWNFEGEQVGTASATTSHAYRAAGTYAVGLTAYDAYGNAQASVESVSVGPAPVPPAPPPPTPPPPTPPPPVVKETLPAHFTLAQLAAKLGLPANGRKLSGRGRIVLGNGECPPACAVTLKLYAKVTTNTHGRRSTKLVPVAALALKIANKATGRLSVTLNSQGRTMLRTLHKLVCQLDVTVEGQEGGSWQMARSLTLTR